MKVAKQAVGYYCSVTGKPWSEFYNNLDAALAADENAPLSDEFWLIRKLIEVIQKHGMTVNDFKINKDAIKGVFDEEARKQAGEFFTPEVWCKEGRTYFDKHIPNWNEMNVWDMCCYSMDTEVFTKRGWVTYDNLKDDDEIYTLNPSTFKGEWSGFHSRFKKPYNGRMLSVDTRKLSMLVTSDHRVFTRTRYTDYEFMSASEVYDSQLSSGRLIPIAAAVETSSTPVYLYNLSDEGMHLFWKTIGFYIGDGYILNDNETICFGFKKQRKVDYLTTLYDKLGLIYKVSELADGRVMFYTRDNFISDYIIREIGTGADTKRIPLGDLSSEYYSDILEGLVESDGYVASNQTCFYTKSKLLANDVQRVAVELGFAVSESVKHGSRNGNATSTYVLCFYKVSETSFKPRSVSLVEYDGYVWDLTTNNDNHIFLVRREGKQFFSSNCGSGNLMRTAGHPTDKLFLSSLQEDDIVLIKNTPEYEGATSFQLDFLEELDYDEVNTAFLDKLPERLQQIIRNDEGLVLYANPPYKSGCAKATDVGRHMIDIGLGAAAYDIYYQFMWRVMHLVEMFKLKNVWFNCFGPLTFFTGSGANVLLKEYEKCFEFVDGMCLSAQEFSDTSDSIVWGIGCTLWKSRGGYVADAPHKDILLDKKYKLPDGSIESAGKVLYEPPREKLSKWVVPKDVVFYENAPVMTSHLTFKGGEVLEKKAYHMGRIAQNALGTLMVGNTLTRSADQSAILSTPTSIQFESITEENFWRCVASYTFRRIIDADWAIAKKEISAPNIKAEGYEEWLRNAVVMFLFEWKSMMNSLRNVEYGGGYCTIRNRLFFLSADEVREHCHDEVILKDLEENPPENEFILKVIAECEPYWHEDVRQLFDWCKEYTLFSYDHRKDVDYKGSLECWDAGFQQLRAALWNEELQKEAERRMLIARDFLRKDIMKFGFVSEIEGE